LAGRGSAEKRNRQNKKRRVRNKSIKSEVGTGMKKFLNAVDNSDADTADAYLKEVEKKIDRAVSKGVYHKNNAARKKQQLYNRLNSIKA
jgi:small subunit ribosomal protein S20